MSEKEEWKTIPGFSRYKMNKEALVRNSDGHIMKAYGYTSTPVTTLVDDDGKKRNIFLYPLRLLLFDIPYTTKSGRKNYGRLSDDDVRYIRANKHAMSGAELARRLNVSESMVCRVKKGNRRANTR